MGTFLEAVLTGIDQGLNGREAKRCLVCDYALAIGDHSQCVYGPSRPDGIYSHSEMIDYLASEPDG